jgi:hypothetical protein
MIVLDILVQSRRNKKAEKKYFMNFINFLQDVTGVIITDERPSTAPFESWDTMGG